MQTRLTNQPAIASDLSAQKHNSKVLLSFSLCMWFCVCMWEKVDTVVGEVGVIELGSASNGRMGYQGNKLRNAEDKVGRVRVE